MSLSEKPTKAFTLSLTAGILIVSNSVLLGASATWFPQIIPTLPGSSNNTTIPFANLTIIGLICGTLVLFGALMLRFGPLNKKIWGALTAGFSVSSIIIGGGFIVGFVLGILGGAYMFTYSPKQKPTKQKLAFLKLTDSTHKMKIEGVGPKIMIPLFLAFAITTWLSYSYEPLFNYSLVDSVSLMLGAGFLAIGVPFWLLATGMFLRAWNREQLETRGPFAIMLNPIYDSFIVFIIPGISLVLNWWPILLASVVMYAANQMFIHEEKNALRQNFGRQYEEYERKVLLKFL